MTHSQMEEGDSSQLLLCRNQGHINPAFLVLAVVIYTLPFLAFRYLAFLTLDRGVSLDQAILYSIHVWEAVLLILLRLKAGQQVCLNQDLTLSCRLLVQMDLTSGNRDRGSDQWEGGERGGGFQESQMQIILSHLVMTMTTYN